MGSIDFAPPSNNSEMHLTVFTTFPLQKFGFAPPIFYFLQVYASGVIWTWKPPLSTPMLMMILKSEKSQINDQIEQTIKNIAVLRKNFTDFVPFLTYKWPSLKNA